MAGPSSLAPTTTRCAAGSTPTGRAACAWRPSWLEGCCLGRRGAVSSTTRRTFATVRSRRRCSLGSTLPARTLHAPCTHPARTLHAPCTHPARTRTLGRLAHALCCTAACPLCPSLCPILPLSAPFCPTLPVLRAAGYTTFAALAGVADPTDHRAARASLPPVDGVDLWPLLSGQNATPPRREVYGDGLYAGGAAQSNRTWPSWRRR